MHNLNINNWLLVSGNAKIVLKTTQTNLKWFRAHPEQIRQSMVFRIAINMHLSASTKLVVEKTRKLDSRKLGSLIFCVTEKYVRKSIVWSRFSKHV